MLQVMGNRGMHGKIRLVEHSLIKDSQLSLSLP